MKRRHLLSLAGLTAGSCLIPAILARRIQDVCIGASQPLILAPENASTLIYAVESFGGYDLHLGNPNDEPDYPTLRDFVEERGFDPDDDDSLREYVIEWRGYAEDFDEEEEGAIGRLKQAMDELIDGGERDYWMEWDMELREGTQPKAFHYLSGLPLIHSKSSHGLSLGQLDFIQGDRPGSNLTYVRAEDHATLACLQHRLNELDEGVRILIDT
jgi:hypothetical protein